MDQYADTILRDGVVVLPLLTLEETTLFREAFKKASEQFPEFLSESDFPYVVGGFGAYGNPASFHNGYARSFRLFTAEPMTRFFQSVVHRLGDADDWYLQRLFDRMCCRPMHSSTSAESVHRDLNPQTAMMTDKTIEITKKNGTTVHMTAYTPRPSDYCFGGWVNLDSDGQIQRFSCVLGSHQDEILMTKGPTESGFDTRETLTRDVTIINVPSGHAIVFFQRIQHLVTPVKQKKDSYRQFQCFRLVRSMDGSIPEPLNGQEELDMCIRNFGVPRLPSGQRPPMYGNNHQSFFLLKNIKSDPAWWSIHKIKPVFLQKKEVVNGKKKGTKYMIAPRFMTSLKEYGMDHYYPHYQDYEINLMKPS